MEPSPGAFRVVSWILRRFCPQALREEIEGDLLHRWQRDEKKWGRRGADRRMIWNALRFFRPGIILRNRFRIRLGTHMITHFLKIFTRTSARDGLYTMINISGLAVGMAAAIFIGIWVLDEWTYDSHHRDRDRIFEVMSQHNFPDGIQTFEDTPGPLGPALADLPMVESSCRILDPFRNQLFSVGEKSFYEQGIFGDSSIMDMLTFHWIEGIPAGALRNNNSIVISESMASKYFGDEKALGKDLILQGNAAVTVTAVFKDNPPNSTLVFDYILPYSIYSSKDPYSNEWGGWSGGVTLIKLREKEDKELVTEAIHEQFTKPHIWVRWDNNVNLFLHDMKDWRLRGTFINGVQSGREDQILGVALVAGFIVLMACSNFVNLATARVSRRAKEIGVRKAIGARRRGLVLQFMTESLAVTIISAVAAVLLVFVFTPYFQTLTHKTVDLIGTIGWFAAGLGGLVVITAVVAGIYPSFFLSSIQAVSAVKGGTPALTGTGLRKGLIVFQFVLSVVFVVGSLVVFQQLEFMRRKDLGFDRENVFFFTYREEFEDHYKEFRQDALSHPSVKHVLRSSYNPMQVFGGMVLADDGWPGKTSEDDLMFYTIEADAEMFDVMGFTLSQGRGFSGTPADSAAYILNEAAVSAMKLSDPVGATIKAPKAGTVVGVVKNFHAHPLREKFQPIIISTRFRDFGVVLVKYEAGRTNEALLAVETAYRKSNPDFPIEIGFMDDTFADQYTDEILMGKLATICTTVALFISCMGLFGLISFSAERRRKEIGVRKVLGAHTPDIVSLLCRDTLLLLLVALVLGIPIAGWASYEFLGQFAFRTDLNLWMAGLVVIAMLLLALITISFQSIRAARVNPADTLRSE